MESQKIKKTTHSQRKISIIIVNWNTKDLLKQCLESLEKESKKVKDQEIIVVDNGSTDGSQEYLKKLKKSKSQNIKIIENKKNLGFGVANNQGMKIAQGEYILLLNSDTVVKKEAPLKMAEFLAQNPQVGVVGCKLLNPDGLPQPSAGPFPFLRVVFGMLFLEHWWKNLARASFKKTTEVDWVMGAAFMIRRDVFQKVGPMDEGIFMYMDEVEWCFRIKKAGYKVIFYPVAEVIHFFGGSSKTGRRDPILNIYRGLLYFYQKHFPNWKLPLLKIMLKLKAVGALVFGYLTNNNYLKKTYVEAYKITQN